MDRLDAMRVFVTALDAGSFAAAARRLGRSPAAVTRAIALLEARVGVALLQRTTRSMRLTEAGARYAPVCRRVLDDLAEAELAAAGERSAPRGVLTITAPVLFGTRILRPVISEFLAAYPDVAVRYVLLDRPVNLIEEGFDIALRIAHLPDSALIAVRLGEVRRIVCAAPEYLAGRPVIAEPADLTRQTCITGGQLDQNEIWTFPPARGGEATRHIRVAARFAVNAVEPAVQAAVAGEGIVRVLSYQIAREMREGRLVVLLRDDEPPPLPVHLLAPEGRLAIAKVRAFVDFATPRLKAAFRDLAAL